ncbi:MAG: hypothetical protein WD738_09385 [Pirellulales bacterium]
MNGWNEKAKAENAANQVFGTIVSRLTTPSAILLSLIMLLLNGGCWSQSVPPRPQSSTRLHLVSVLYGRYLSANDGKMPRNQEELVEYIDENEGEVLQRRSLSSGEEIFKAPPGGSRIVVLYREPRERLKTEYVAIEEQKMDPKNGDGEKSRSRWFAADVLGVGQEIDQVEAARMLTEAGDDAEKT